MKNLKLILLMSITALASISAHACGYVFENTNVTFNADMNCANEDGTYGIIIKGDNIIVNGKGHTIYAPNNKFIIYLEGSNITVKNLTILGSESTRAITAYNVLGLEVKNVTAEHHMIAMDYSNDMSIKQNSIKNKISFINNSFEYSSIGLKFEAKNYPFTPTMKNNYFAFNNNDINFSAQSFSINGKQANKFHKSFYGIMVDAYNVAIQNVDLSNVIKKPISINNAHAAYIKGVNVSGNYNVAISVDNTEHVSLIDSDISQADVGIKINIPRNKTTVLYSKNIQHGDNKLSPIMIHNEQEEYLRDYAFDGTRNFDHK